MQILEKINSKNFKSRYNYVPALFVCKKGGKGMEVMTSSYKNGNVKVCVKTENNEVVELTTDWDEEIVNPMGYVDLSNSKKEDLIKINGLGVYTGIIAGRNRTLYGLFAFCKNPSRKENCV